MGTTVIITIILLAIALLCFSGNRIAAVEDKSNKTEAHDFLWSENNKYFRNMVDDFVFDFELEIIPDYENIENFKSIEFPILKRYSGRNFLNRISALIVKNNEDKMYRDFWKDKSLKPVKILKIIHWQYHSKPSIEQMEKICEALEFIKNSDYLNAINIYQVLLKQGDQFSSKLKGVLSNNIGCLKIKAGNKMGFVGDFNKAFRYYYKPQFLYNLGCAYTHIGNWEKAIFNFKQANFGNSKEIVDFLEKVEIVKIKAEPIPEVSNKTKDLTRFELLTAELTTNEFKSHQINEITQVYVGIPNDIANRILWVLDKFRTNPLSLMPGGTTVVVEFRSGEVLGYDKIKRPSAYIKKFWEGEYTYENPEYEFYTNQKKVEFYKERINRIFAKNINGTESSFKEVWNFKSATKLPWEVLKVFDEFENEVTLKRAEIKKTLTEYDLSTLKDRNLGDCKGMMISKILKTNPTGSTAVKFKMPGLNYGVDEYGKPRNSITLLLEKKCADMFVVGTYPSKDCIIREFFDKNGEIQYQLELPVNCYTTNIDDL